MRAFPILSLLMLILATSCTADNAPTGDNAFGIWESPAGTVCKQSSLKPPVQIHCGSDTAISAVVDRAEPGSGSLESTFGAGRWGSETAALLDCGGAATESRPLATTGTILTKQCHGRDTAHAPQLAVVARVGSQTWVARGEPAFEPAIERAIGYLARHEALPAATETSPSANTDTTDELFKRARDEGSNPVLYADLKQRGATASLMGHWTEAQTAFDGALLQLCKIKNLNESPCPKQAGTASGDMWPAAELAMSVGLQLSNRGQFGQAKLKFAQAEAVSVWPIDKARLQLYLASHAMNRYDPADNRSASFLDESLKRLADAEALFRTETPPAKIQVALTLDAMKSAGPATQFAPDVRRSHIKTLAERLIPDQKTALLGVSETLRVRAIVHRLQGRLSQSEADVLAADEFEKVNGLTQRASTAQLSRTLGLAYLAAQRAGQNRTDDALLNLDMARTTFDKASLWRSSVQSQLREATVYGGANKPADGARHCDEAFERLRLKGDYAENDLVADCLANYEAMARTETANNAAWFEKMFATLQLAMRGSASEDIQKAADLLLRNAYSPKPGVMSAIVALKPQIETSSADAKRLGTAAANVRRQCADLPDPRTAQTQTQAIKFNADLQACDTQLRAAEQEAGEAVTRHGALEAKLEAVYPAYGQLRQSVKSTAEIKATLNPNETFAAIALTERGGWIFLLRREDALPTVGRISKGSADIQRLVLRLRKSVADTSRPSFEDNATAAHLLYDAIFGDASVRETLARALKAVPPTDADAPSLVVATSGSLLNVPFQVLLTQPPRGGNLVNAKWLLNDFVIQNVPSAANFVLLRQASRDTIASNSRAPRPWFGLGGSLPVPQPKITRGAAADPDGCVDPQSQVSQLSSLERSRSELDFGAKLFSASTNERLTGAAFTADSVRNPPPGVVLDRFNIIHIAAHALVQPGCKSEPAIVTSFPTGGKDMGAVMLKASDILSSMRLNADSVILSACSSGTSQRIFSDTSHGQEEMSTLATSFFAAGARSVLASLWNADAGWTPYLITGVLQSLKENPRAGIAAAVRRSQIALIKEELKDRGQPLHPALWAPFVVIGEGGEGVGAPAQTKITSN